MSFDLEDIAEELSSATDRGREWFDSQGYSFQRLGKVRNVDLDKLANLLRYRRWAEANRERQREISREYYRRHPEKRRRLNALKRKRLKANQKSHAKRLASWRAYRERQRADPAKMAHLAELARLRYARKAKASLPPTPGDKASTRGDSLRRPVDAQL